VNVALMNDSFPPMVDGVSRCTLGYAKAIHEGNYGKLIVVAPRQPGVKYDYPFPVYCFNSLSTGYHEFRAGHPFMPKLISQMYKLKIDIIHAHSPFIAMAAARQVRKFLRIPIVFTQHTKWDYDLARAIPVKSFANNLERFAYYNINAADDVWAVSNQTGEYMYERGFKGSYMVMPNGTDFPKGEADETLLRSIKGRFNLPCNVPVLLFVGRMMWYKGIGFILDALEILNKNSFDFRMIFVGDGEDLKKAKKISANKKLDDKVHFAGRENDREMLRAYYTIAELFILPSVYDNAPLVLQEAAACSCPSIVVEGSSAAEIIEDGVTGYYCTQSAQNLADRINEIFRDKEKHEVVSHAVSEELYTPWSKVVERSMKRYRIVKDKYIKSGKAKPMDDLKKTVRTLKALRVKKTT